MDKNQELLACFKKEIEEISNAEMQRIRQEMDTIRERTEQEIETAAWESAQRWYAQEAEELTSQYAAAMSHLSDETHYRLMKERTALVDSLFDEVKQRLQEYRHSDNYVKDMKERLSLCGKNQKNAILQVAADEEAVLPQLMQILDASCKSEIVNDIALGGFRLVLGTAARIIDETYDSALREAKEQFLQTSGLTIA